MLNYHKQKYLHKINIIIRKQLFRSLEKKILYLNPCPSILQQVMRIAMSKVDVCEDSENRIYTS